MKRLTSLAMSFLMACACTHSALASPGVPAGWKKVHASGVTIALPPELIVSDFSKGDLQKILSQFAKRYPNQPEMTTSLRQLAASGAYKLVAINPTPTDGWFRRNFNLLVLAVPPGQTLAQMIDLNRQQLIRLALPGSVSVKKTSVSAGVAIALHAAMSSPKGSESVVGYIIVRGSTQYVFTFTCADSEKAMWARAADKAIQTVRFDH